MIQYDSWLTPEGVLIEVGKFNHNNYASKILEEETGSDKYLEHKYPYEILHERGWIRISVNDYLPKIQIFGGCIDLTQPMRNTMCPAMNIKQLTIAKKLCKEFNTPFHTAINDKRFW